MNNYLIPANSKKGQLIFNMFRWEDLIILAAGGLITLIAVLVSDNDSIFAMVLKLLPIGISVLLVMPVAYYHNVLVFIIEMFCDRVAASKIYNKGKYNDSMPLEYYLRVKHRRIIEKKTARKLEFLLTMLRDRGENYTFRYIRKRILRAK